MFKALIVDDEAAAAGSLEILLKRYVCDVTVAGIARSVAEAVQMVEAISPSIVFLDIEMPGGSGFDFLEQCATRHFEVVFTTAYETYAIRAFRYSAVDYLLKPIGVDELQRAVEKASKRLDSKFDSRKKYYALFENIKTILPFKLVVTVQNRNEFVNLPDITYFEMQASGANVYRHDGTCLHIDNNLPDLVEILDRKNFFKINDRQVVNTAMVRRVTRSTVDLSNGVSLQLEPVLRKELVDYVEKSINTLDEK